MTWDQRRFATSVQPQAVIRSLPPTVNEAFADLVADIDRTQAPQHTDPPIARDETCARVYELRMRFVATDDASADTVRQLCTGVFSGDNAMVMLLGFELKERP